MKARQGQDNGEFRRAWFTTAGPAGHAKDSRIFVLDILQSKRGGWGISGEGLVLWFAGRLSPRIQVIIK